MTLGNLTDEQLKRLYKKVYRKIREGYGYQPFGFDWPTLRINKPGMAKVLKNILEEIEIREVRL